MRFEEYRRHDAISLAGLIAKREVSAKEVLETAIARVEQVNPAINAIVHKQYEQARKAVAAGLPEGPLKGVPYLIKDLAGCGKSSDFGKMVMKRARSGNPGIIKSTGYEGAKTNELGWKQHRPTFSAAC